jgi:DNA-binding NarL/FixJ family response regulator
VAGVSRRGQRRPGRGAPARAARLRPAARLGAHREAAEQLRLALLYHQPASRANPAGLTPREIEVLGLLADGLSYAEIADRLILSQKTVGHHVSAVLRKLSEPTGPRAVGAALRLRIIPPKIGNPPDVQAGQAEVS